MIKQLKVVIWMNSFRKQDIMEYLFPSNFVKFEYSYSKLPHGYVPLAYRYFQLLHISELHRCLASPLEVAHFGRNIGRES